jgi:hypothetical protein
MLDKTFYVYMVATGISIGMRSALCVFLVFIFILLKKEPVKPINVTSEHFF